MDALAGGGGLVTLPAYLAAGLDPGLVLGTNKLSSSIGTVAASLHYHRGRRWNPEPLLPACAAALLGAWLGARLASRLDPSWLKPLLLLALPGVAAVVHSPHHFTREDHSASLGPGRLALRAALAALPLAAYDGFFGPGTGTFLALALSKACRHDLLGATARAKVLNLVSNLAALAAFLQAGRVRLILGLAMGGASVAGNVLGSHLGLRRGAAAIRPAVLAVCAGLFLKILADYF